MSNTCHQRSVRKSFGLVWLGMFMVVVVVGCTSEIGTPAPLPMVPTQSPTPEPTSTDTPSPTPEPTATDTPAPTPIEEPTATFTPTATPIPLNCSNGVVVREPSRNLGLVSDCETLLAIKAVLDPDGRLNWAADRDIYVWDGIRIIDWPSRVTTLDVNSRFLGGGIPEQLADLSHLIVLNLGETRLIGGIPETLSELGMLRELHLYTNHLEGEIPATLANIESLEVLDLGGNRLTGSIPANLGNPLSMRW